MKTVPISKNILPFQLHEELEGAGIKVVTVRGFNTDPTTNIAPKGEILCDDASDPQMIQAIIGSHSPKVSIIKNPNADNLLQKLESGKATNVEIAEALALVLKHLRGMA